MLFAATEEPKRYVTGLGLTKAKYEIAGLGVNVKYVCVMHPNYRTQLVCVHLTPACCNEVVLCSLKQDDSWY